MLAFLKLFTIKSIKRSIREWIFIATTNNSFRRRTFCSRHPNRLIKFQENTIRNVMEFSPQERAPHLDNNENVWSNFRGR